MLGKGPRAPGIDKTINVQLKVKIFIIVIIYPVVINYYCYKYLS